MSAYVFQDGAVQPIPLPVGLRRDGIFRVQEPLQGVRSEKIILGPQGDRELNSVFIAGNKVGRQGESHPTGRELAAGFEPVPGLQAPPGNAHHGGKAVHQERSLNSPGQGNIGPKARAGRSKGEDVVPFQRQGSPHRGGLMIDLREQIASGEGDLYIPKGPDLETVSQSNFHRGSVFGISREDIGQPESIFIHGSGNGDPEFAVTVPPAILDRREKPGMYDLDHQTRSSPQLGHGNDLDPLGLEPFPQGLDDFHGSGLVPVDHDGIR